MPWTYCADIMVDFAQPVLRAFCGQICDTHQSNAISSGSVCGSNLYFLPRVLHFEMQELTKMVASCEKDLPDYVAQGLNKQLEELDRVLGGCERIISTPIPLSYTRHTTRCISIYALGET